MTKTTNLIKKMSLEEKAALCTGAGRWTTTPVERLGIPEMTVTDGPHGVRRVKDIHTFTSKSEPATCFPTAACMASTWDVDLIHKLGEAIAEECIALQVDVVETGAVSLAVEGELHRNLDAAGLQQELDRVFNTGKTAEAAA